MTPKPSRRRDSLEKAARKESQRWIGATINDLLADLLEERLSRLLQRHGAKVRRETLKEAAEKIIVAPPAVNRLRILSLTPRGPEKGRRAR